MLAPGDLGPDFTLEGTRGDAIREFTLSAFAAGRPSVLVFYIYDFSPVCTTQMCEVNDMEILTFNDDAGVLGISTDGPYSHQQFIEENHISYPLLSDPDKEVYEHYGMIERSDAGKKLPRRGVVLLDGDRTVEYVWQAQDNWDEWNMEPLYEINDRINELIE
jgi:peroxiredoxin